MSHTPTPWRIGKNGGVVSDSAEGLVINGAFGKEAVEYYGGNLICESVTRANAEFIVEACNAHERLKRERDALLEASIKILKEIDEFVQWHEPGYPPENTEGLKEALALCEERKGQ